MDEKVINIFYNSIIPEAYKGRIDSFFMYNVKFNTTIADYVMYGSNENTEMLVPTLNIQDEELFNRYLVEYVKQALDFYDDSNFPDEILDDKMIEEENICKEKTILALLFANATWEDFDNPIEYIKRRIDFFNSVKEKHCNLGHSDILNSDLKIDIVKDKINLETPYMFSLTSVNNEGLEFEFPKVKFGISNDTVYIYAIQNEKTEKNDYSKKINRLLYKVDEGFDGKNDNYDKYEEGNLKDITPSFILVINVFISYLYNEGFTKFKVSSMLPERWNAKIISNQHKLSKGKISLEEAKETKKKVIAIQKNLTEKLIRSFLRVVYHYDGMDTLSYPAELDSYLNIAVHELSLCNNSLLAETSNIAMNSENSNKIMI